MARELGLLAFAQTRPSRSHNIGARISLFLIQFHSKLFILLFIDTFTRHRRRLQHANFRDWRASLRRPEFGVAVLSITLENAASCERNQRNFRPSRIQLCLTDVSCVL